MFERLDPNDDEGFTPLVKLFRSLLGSISTPLPPLISGTALQQLTERMSKSSSLKVRNLKSRLTEGPKGNCTLHLPALKGNEQIVFCPSNRSAVL